MKNLIYFLTKIYRLYCFYMSPGHFLIRDTMKNFFSKQSPCPKVLEVGGGNAMMKNLLKTSCRSEQFISTDIAPTEHTDVVCDAQDLPFSDLEFDLVAAFNVMEHIPNTNQFLSEVGRVLKDDGYVAMAIPFMYGEHDHQDFYRWTPQGLEKVLDEHGFKVVLLRKNGGIFSTIISLFSHYIHQRTAPSGIGWRASKYTEKLYFLILRIVLFPLDVVYWLAYGLDFLIDNDSANPGGLIFIARKSSYA